MDILPAEEASVTGRVHSFETLAALDGPGLRTAVFMQGCPLRCACCHNPDTQDVGGGTIITAAAAAKKVLRCKPYFGLKGGVTATGGEPLFQAAFCAELFKRLKYEGVHTVLDTSGCLSGSDVHILLQNTDLVLLDIKMPDEARYKQYTGGSLVKTLEFLKEAEQAGCEILLRSVILPGINDSDDDLLKLAQIAALHRQVTGIELLPYHRMGTEKYRLLGRPYALESVPEADPALVEEMNKSVLERMRAIRANQ